MKYAVVFEKADHNWAAYVPDLPGCVTTGATLQDTRRLIAEAIYSRLHLPDTPATAASAVGVTLPGVPLRDEQRGIYGIFGHRVICCRILIRLRKVSMTIVRAEQH
jgi:predicted RNase H-like HicB family nuclease